MASYKKIISLLFFLLTGNIYFPIFSETIKLKSSNTIEGEILEKGSDYIKIYYHDMPLTYYFDQIETINALPPEIFLSKKEITEKLKILLKKQHRAYLRGKNNRKLSYDDLEYGQLQVELMLKDRPNMAYYINDDGEKKLLTLDDSIYQWAIRKFAGEDLNTTIDWNPQAPAEGYAIDADHMSPTEKSRGYIRVNLVYRSGENRDQPKNFQDLWENAFFELHNIGMAKKFKEVTDNAYAGKLNKEEYIKGITLIEYSAVKKLQDFYRKVFAPWLVKNNLSIDQKSHFAGLMFFNTYDNWIKWLRTQEMDYLISYGDFYDRQILPYIQERQKREKKY